MKTKRNINLFVIIIKNITCNDKNIRYIFIHYYNNDSFDSRWSLLIQRDCKDRQIIYIYILDYFYIKREWQKILPARRNTGAIHACRCTWPNDDQRNTIDWLNKLKQVSLGDKGMKYGKNKSTETRSKIVFVLSANKRSLILFWSFPGLYFASFFLAFVFRHSP